MSPEAIELPEGMRRLKVGRPSDVWSLGCILYQMVYGQPPFQHLSVYQKMKAIPDLAHEIEFPEFSIPCVVNKNGERKKLDHLKQPVRADVIRGMRSCLARHPKERATIPELLEQEWLAMRERQCVIRVSTCFANIHDSPSSSSKDVTGERRDHYKSLLYETIA